MDRDLKISKKLFFTSILPYVIHKKMIMFRLILIILITSLTCSTQIDVLPRIKEPFEHGICFTAECLMTGSRIRSWMNSKIDPCNNFYEYACSGFYPEIDLNQENNNLKVTPFTLLNEKIEKQLIKLLQEPHRDDDIKPFQYSKNLFKKCINTLNDNNQNYNSDDALKFIDTLATIDNWPILNGTQWDKNSWSWINVLQKFRRVGLPYGLLFELSLKRDQRNTSQVLLKVKRKSNCKKECEVSATTT